MLGAALMPVHSKLLATMGRDEFLRAVEKARVEAQAAEDVRASLSLWSERLEPYLRESDCTIEEALSRYKRDHGSAL